MVQDDNVAWWVDSGATVHVCKDRFWFKTYESLNDGSILHMSNESTALVHGCGCVDFKFSSRKIVSLFNVLHVPIIRKNFDSISVLNNNGYKQVIESNKFVIQPWVPNKRNTITPYELCTKKKPNLNYLRVWGCRTVVRLFDQKLKTLGKRGIECIFVGYAEHSKAFRFFSVPRPSLRIPNGTEDIGGLVVLEEVTEEYHKTADNMIIHQMDVKTAFLNGNLDEEFSMNDMGEADVILGIKIKYESNGIVISQSHYIKKVPKKFNYFDCTPVSNLMDTSEKLMLNNGQYASQLEYSRVIGCLMYIMTCTRPAIAFVVGKLSMYTSNPAADKEAEWLKNLLHEISLLSKPITPISIRCDSAATLAKAYS
nr:zinc finger, CCHC-type [Tanacetum cinerariifolium]